MDAATMEALISRAIAEGVRLAGGAAGVAAGGGGAAAEKNVKKRYGQVEKLSGPSDWKEWHYQFVVATKAFAPDLGALLEKVQALDIVGEVTADELSNGRNPNEISMEEERRMAGTMHEMYSVFGLWTKGEANQVVRSVTDGNGWVAWKRLYDRFNPRTPASLTAAWREVIRPKKVKDLREIAKVIDGWEAKIELLRREHGEEPTTGLKASLLLEMLPDSVQLTVAQGLTGRKLDFDELKTKVRLMGSVQADMATPKPMDIGVLQESESEKHHDEGGWEEVGVVGKGKGKGSGPVYGSCWTCGGQHYASECPYNGKGTKGTKGAAKGTNKGGAMMKGTGKGKSRGPMYGSCWTCGGDHYQSECPQLGKGKAKGKGKALREIDEEPEDHQDVGSVGECWNIFGLDTVGRRSRMRARPSKWTRTGNGVVTLSNRFLELAEVDEEMDDNCHVTTDCQAKVDCCVKSDGHAEFDDHAGEPEEMLWIQGVLEDGKVESRVSGEIIVDSGAAESVCPWEWAEQFPIREVAPGRERSFVNASGGRMGHYGERQVVCGVKGLSAPVAMKFQVSDARHPLASVARITEQGNIVQFGPQQQDNYIYNPSTDEKVLLRRKGKKFVMDVNFLGTRSLFSGQA